MEVKNFYISTFPITIGKISKISSDTLNSFFSATSQDLAQIQSILNTNVCKFLSTLPTTVDITTDNLDATTLVVDTNSSATKDSGIFYDSDNARPTTIYETLLSFLQILANTENGLREGVKIGTYSSKITLANNESIIKPWAYSDKTFFPLLYVLSGNNVSLTTNSQLTIHIDISSNELHITNISGGSLSLWGYVWHPIFTF